MRKLFFWTVGAVVFGSFVACVSNDPTSGAAEGTNGGACFSNNTCNPGLSCDPASNTCSVGDASSGDASSTSDAAATDSGSTVDESGVLACSFSTTFYPCNENPLPAQNCCYGDTFTCSTSGCGGANVTIWGCFSPNQCSTGIPCCVPIAGNALSAGTTCAEGTLVIGDAGAQAAHCGTAMGACPADQYQLCQTNKQCPTGYRCNLVKVTGRVTLDMPDGGPGSSVDIGACVPD